MDGAPTNRDFAKRLGYTNEQLNEIEKKLLTALKYQTGVADEVSVIGAFNSVADDCRNSGVKVGYLTEVVLREQPVQWL